MKHNFFINAAIFLFLIPTFVISKHDGSTVYGQNASKTTSMDSLYLLLEKNFQKLAKEANEEFNELTARFEKAKRKKDINEIKRVGEDVIAYLKKWNAYDSDTLIVQARLVEKTPDEMPEEWLPGISCDYIFYMKYHILSIEKGQYDGDYLAVGHYKPREPRTKLSGKLGHAVGGNATSFNVGDVHRMVLVREDTFFAAHEEAVHTENYYFEYGTFYIAVITDNRNR